MAAFDVERSKFAICRLSKVELSDGTPRYRTLGSGSVVRSEELRQKLKSDRAVFLITTSEVITESLLNVKQRRPTYKIIAEFQKKSASNKFETLEINAQLLSSTKSKGANTWTVRGVVYIALTKLDKWYRFKWKSSVITTRPLDIMLKHSSFEDELENSYNCLVLSDAIGNHAKGFGMRLYKLKSRGQGEGFLLKWEGRSSKTAIRCNISDFGEHEFPHGSAVLSHEGLFVGVLEFDKPKLPISPVSLFKTVFEEGKNF